MLRRIQGLLLQSSRTGWCPEKHDIERILLPCQKTLRVTLSSLLELQNDKSSCNLSIQIADRKKSSASGWRSDSHGSPVLLRNPASKEMITCQPVQVCQNLHCNNKSWRAVLGRKAISLATDTAVAGKAVDGVLSNGAGTSGLQCHFENSRCVGKYSAHEQVPQHVNAARLSRPELNPLQGFTIDFADSPFLC